MKLFPLLIVGSLAANAALVVVYVNRSHAEAGSVSADASPPAPPGTKTVSGKRDGDENKNPGPASSVHSDSAAIQGQASGTWANLNTKDLAALAKRLRAAGFPPSAVRAVIGAQVRESFKSRFEALRPAAEDRPFWKTDGNGFSGYDSKYYAAMRELGREQSKVLKEILGPDETSGDTPASEAQQRRYGHIPSDKIEQLQRLDQDYNDLRNEVNQAARGIVLPEDRQKLAMLEQERRADLAQLLSPQEMEDYLMRSSSTTNRLRPALTASNATEAEFRAIYQAQLAYDEKYNASALGRSIDAEEMRKDREAANEQIKAALGEPRYAEYARASDREFQQLNRMAQQSNLPDAVAAQVYDLRNNVLKESNRIYEDASLNADQKRAAIQALGQTARADITTALGADLGTRYLQLANRWLSGLDRGAAVTLTENGMSIRNVGSRAPNPNPGARGNSSAPPTPAAK